MVTIQIKCPVTTTVSVICCLHQSQNTLYLTCGLFLEAGKNVLNAKMIVLVNDASFVNKQTDLYIKMCCQVVA